MSYNCKSNVIKTSVWVLIPYACFYWWRGHLFLSLLLVMVPPFHCLLFVPLLKSEFVTNVIQLRNNYNENI